MKATTKVGIALLPIVIVMTTVFVLYSCEVSSISYASYEEAKSRGAIGAGTWLPSLIPTTARDIWESHDVDSNEVWFSFRFGRNFVPPAESCTGVDKSTVVVPAPSRWDRFPTFVEEARIQVLRPEMRLFACQGESYQLFLAVDEAESLAIGWSAAD